MKYIKTFFKIIGILLIPFFFQTIVTIAVLVPNILALPAEVMSDPNLVTTEVAGLTAKYISTIILIANVLVVLLLLIIAAARKQKFADYYDFRKMDKKQVPLVAAISFLGLFFALAFSSIADLGSVDPVTAETLSNLMFGNALVSFLSIGILAPLAEELIFRGAIFRNLKRVSGIKVAIILQALIFSLYHMNIIQAVPTFVLGLNAGIVLLMTRSMWAAIMVHAINNIMAVAMSYLLPASFDIPMVVNYVLLVLAPVGLVFVHRKLREIRTPEPVVTVMEEAAVEEAFVFLEGEAIEEKDVY